MKDVLNVAFESNFPCILIIADQVRILKKFQLIYHDRYIPFFLLFSATDIHPLHITQFWKSRQGEYLALYLYQMKVYVNHLCVIFTLIPTYIIIPNHERKYAVHFYRWILNFLRYFTYLINWYPLMRAKMSSALGFY